MPKRADRPRRDRKRSKTLRTNVPGPRLPTCDAEGGGSRLARVLDSPHLTRVVPRLSPEALHHLIRDHGLEACGHLIAASTPRQVASILDLDLWRTTPGGGEQFDERRFGAWLEMLIDTGEAVAARVVAAIDPDVAVAGLSRYVRVFDPGALQSDASGDDDFGADVEPKDLERELGGYLVRARTADAWDAIVGLLVTLAEDRPDTFHALMQGCRRMSNSRPEPDGFHDLMEEPEQLLHDVAVQREGRRSGQGYLSTGDARAFLEMARQPRRSGPTGPSSIDAIAAAYFRAVDDAERSAGQSAPLEEQSAQLRTDREVLEASAVLADLLAEAGIASGGPRPLLGPAPADVARVTPLVACISQNYSGPPVGRPACMWPRQRSGHSGSSPHIPLVPLLDYVHDTAPDAYFTRNRELAFLANALLAGCSVHSRAFTVQEAWDAAVGICNLGLEPRPSDLTSVLSDTFLIDHDLVTAFEAGWRRLHEDVGMFVAGHLIEMLGNLRSVDSEIQRDLYRLRRELERHRNAGTPWRALEALEVIGIIDMPAWACLRGLLSECPVLPDALTALVEGRPRSVSATAFTCFSTRGQLAKVREFVERLRDLLLS